LGKNAVENFSKSREIFIFQRCAVHKFVLQIVNLQIFGLK